MGFSEKTSRRNFLKTSGGTFVAAYLSAISGASGDTLAERIYNPLPISKLTPIEEMKIALMTKFSNYSDRKEAYFTVNIEPGAAREYRDSDLPIRVHSPEYLARRDQVGMLAYALHKIETAETEESRLAALKQINEWLKTGKTSDEFERDFDHAVFSKADRISRDQRVKADVANSAITVLTIPAGKKGKVVGEALKAVIELYPTWKYDSNIDIDAATIRVHELLIREAFIRYKTDPSSKDFFERAEVKKAFGFDPNMSVEDYIEKLPEGKMRDIWKEAVKISEHGQIISKENGEKIFAEVASELIDKNKKITEKAIDDYKKRTGELKSDIADEVIKKLEEKEKAEEDERLAREKEQAEYDGAAYLASVLADKFISREAGQAISTLYSTFNQLRTTVSNFANNTRGIISTAASMTSIMGAISALSSLSGGFADPTLEALKEVKESIKAMHDEMRQSFNLLLDTQKEVLKRLENISDDLDQIKKDLAEIKEQLSLSDRRDRMSKLDEVYMEMFGNDGLFMTESAETDANKLDQDELQRALERYVTIAVEGSKNTKLIKSEIKEWDAAVIKRELTSQLTSIDSSVGLIPTIFFHILDKEMPDKPKFRNLKVFTKAEYALAIGANRVPQVINGGLKEFIQRLLGARREIERDYKGAYSAEFITGLADNLTVAFDSMVDTYLSQAYAGLVKMNTGGLPKKTKPADVYPFESALLPPRDSMVRYEAKREKNQSRKIIEQHKGDNGALFYSYRGYYVYVKYDPLELGQRYGLLNMQMVKDWDLSKTYKGQILKVGDNTLTGHFLMGLYKDKNFHAKWGYPAVIKKDEVVINGKLETDLIRFLQSLDGGISEAHQQLQIEFEKKFKGSLKKDASENKVAEFEALAASLSYIAGLKLWLENGDSEAARNHALMVDDNLFGTGNAVEKLFDKVLNPENRPTDEKDNPIPIAENIATYAGKAMKEKFRDNLKRYMNLYLSADLKITMPDYVEANRAIDAILARPIERSR